jgi:hypothetical protein
MGRHEPSPPGWAEWVLVALLPASRAECESGDLLEAYRDQQVPARGRAGADRWYLRQVALVFLHTCWFWPAALIALFVAGDVANAYRFDFPVRVGPIVVALMLGASVHGGWRSAQIRGGVLAGAATCALLWLFMSAWWMTTWYPFSLVQQNQPYWIAAWHSSAAPGETFTHWIFWDNVGAAILSGVVLNAAGIAAGLAGGIAGATARKKT